MILSTEAVSLASTSSSQLTYTVDGLRPVVLRVSCPRRRGVVWRDAIADSTHSWASRRVQVQAGE